MTAPRRALRSSRLDPERLVDHVDRLYRAAWGLCGDPHDAEDLVQETYTRVLSRPRRVRRGGEIGYLLTALRNTHVSRLRSAGRHDADVSLDDSPLEPTAGNGSAPELAFEVRELFAAIAELPLWGREAIVMVDVAGLSYREAADVLRIKEATVTTRLHRARRQVAKALAPTPDPIASSS